MFFGKAQISITQIETNIRIWLSRFPGLSYDEKTMGNKDIYT